MSQNKSLQYRTYCIKGRIQDSFHQYLYSWETLVELEFETIQMAQSYIDYNFKHWDKGSIKIDLIS